MLFELDSVSARRGGEPVFEGLDLTVAEGATAIVGPSGSGKSSLLRLLNRLAEPDAGTVAYRDRPLAEREVTALRREVALVPQLPALLEGTIGENMRFAAELGDRELSDDEIAALLRRAGLEGSFAERAGDKLSVGEQQRAMLARALVNDPRVLLLDEPTSALDPETTGAVEATLAALREQTDLSFVVVTHDPAQAERLGDTVIDLPSSVAGTAT